jgi:uncharacterized DUF497 family protein
VTYLLDTHLLLWAAIFSTGGPAVRLISARRARANEEQLYESTSL